MTRLEMLVVFHKYIRKQAEEGGSPEIIAAYHNLCLVHPGFESKPVCLFIETVGTSVTDCDRWCHRHGFKAVLAGLDKAIVKLQKGLVS